MQKLAISMSEHPDHSEVEIVTFEGDFDGYAKENITEIQQYVDEITEANTIVFDFSKLNYLNSYAIGHLVAWHNHVKKLGGKIIIIGVNKNVEDIFAILGISSVFKVYPDLDAAASEFGTT